MTDTPNPDLLVLARLALANGHDRLDSPESLTAYEQTVLLARETTCDACEVLTEVVPAYGHRWVIEEHHEPSCPQHEDHTPGLHRDAATYPPDWT